MYVKRRLNQSETDLGPRYAREQIRFSLLQRNFCTLMKDVHYSHKFCMICCVIAFCFV